MEAPLYLKRVLDAKTEVYPVERERERENISGLYSTWTKDPHAQCCLLREDFVSNIYFL